MGVIDEVQSGYHICVKNSVAEIFIWSNWSRLNTATFERYG
jgi:hypothetical protein